MRQIAFDSTNIDQARWHQPKNEISACDVLFTNGSTYRFFGIPESLIDQWEADSKLPNGSAGKFFNANIRNKFSSVKLQCQKCKKVFANETELGELLIVDASGFLRAYCKACYK